MMSNEREREREREREEARSGKLFSFRNKKNFAKLFFYLKCVFD